MVSIAVSRSLHATVTGSRVSQGSRAFCYWDTRRVVTMPWKITLKQRVLRLLSRNLCVVVSGLHLLLCVVVLNQPIRGPILWPSGQLDAWNSSGIFHSYSFQWPTWQCLIWRLKNEDIRLILRWNSYWTSIMPATSARQQLSREE